MRYSIKGILEASSPYEISTISGLPEDICLEKINYLAENTDELPSTEEDQNLDVALACIAVRTAVARHAGRIEEYYTPMGVSYVQTGKDLGSVETIIETGGALVRTGYAEKIGQYALYSPKDPMSLRPKKAKILTDRKYILAAMGLLSIRAFQSTRYSLKSLRRQRRMAEPSYNQEPALDCLRTT